MTGDKMWDEMWYCEYCKHYDNEDGIEVCNHLMEALDYIDTEDCEYYEDKE